MISSENVKWIKRQNKESLINIHFYFEKSDTEQWVKGYWSEEDGGTYWEVQGFIWKDQRREGSIAIWQWQSYGWACIILLFIFKDWFGLEFKLLPFV